MTRPPATAPTKERRIAAARGRIEFWSIWQEEVTDPWMKDYCRARLRSWTYEICHIENEPDPDPPTLAPNAATPINPLD